MVGIRWSRNVLSWDLLGHGRYPVACYGPKAEPTGPVMTLLFPATAEIKSWSSVIQGVLQVPGVEHSGQCAKAAEWWRSAHAT
jgi:hypothetical protein